MKFRVNHRFHDVFPVVVDDNNPGMKHFVANDLEYKIKISSPVGTGQSLNSLPKQFSSSLPPQLDSNVLNDLEIEAQYLAANIDNLTENLANLLHSISSITADNVEVYKNSVTKLTDTIDSNIKSMYSIIAKSEEISKSMHKAEQMAVRIREIRRLVDMFEATL
jgi:BLOC-1 related complex subunit 6